MTIYLPPEFLLAVCAAVALGGLLYGKRMRWPIFGLAALGAGYILGGGWLWAGLVICFLSIYDGLRPPEKT